MHEYAKSRAVYAIVSHYGPRVTVYYAAHDNARAIGRTIEFSDLPAMIGKKVPILRFDVTEDAPLAFINPRESHGDGPTLTECIDIWQGKGIPIEYIGALSPAVERMY